MGAGIGLASLVVALGGFLPSVLHALERFLLAFLDKATFLFGAIQLPAVPFGVQ